MDGLTVLGVGTAFPPLRLGNEEVLRALPDEAFGPRGRGGDDQVAFLAQGMAETLGVRERAWCHRVGKPLGHGTELTTVELAVQASSRALEDAQLRPQDISLLICATSTPHRMTATVSAAVGAALGLSSACMDVRTGCAAGVFGLVTGALYLQAGTGPVLLVGTETFSKVIPPHSRLAALALADGAGALVLGAGEGTLEAGWLETDGTLGNLLTTEGALPPTSDDLLRGGYWLSGSPDAFTEQVRDKYARAIRGVLGRAGVSAESVDLYVPHQASRALILDVAARMGVPAERAFINVERHANIGAAGWLVAFAEAQEAGLVLPGRRVLLASVGGGMSWGAALWRC